MKLGRLSREPKNMVITAPASHQSGSGMVESASILASNHGGLIAAIQEKLKDGKSDIDVRGHEQSVYAGSIGAALWGAFRHEKLSREEQAGAGA